MASRSAALIARRALPTATRFSCAVPLGARPFQDSAALSNGPRFGLRAPAAPAAASPASSSTRGAAPSATETPTTRTVHVGSETPVASTSSSSSSPSSAGTSAEKVPPASAVNEAVEAQPEAPAVSPVEAWSRNGVDPAVAAALAKHFPHVLAPTQAQQAFLLSLLRGDVDVYYKDTMGKGKTFSLVVGALTLVRRGKGDSQIVIIVPSAHLAEQVGNLFSTLTSDDRPVHTVLDAKKPNWAAQVVVATPKAILDAPPPKQMPKLSHIFLDEPDSMLGTLPSRFTSDRRVGTHPVNQHPPPVVHALNSLLHIRSELVRGEKPKDPATTIYDFSNRLGHVRTVWASATLPTALRRFAYGRGWVQAGSRSGDTARGIIDLDFTETANERHQQTNENFTQMANMAKLPTTKLAPVPAPKHYAFVVGRTGDIRPLDMAVDAARPGKAADDSVISRTTSEAVAFLYATSPPPAGRYALALLPNRASISRMVSELSLLGLPVETLVPEVIKRGVPAPDPGMPAPILVAHRAAVTGLHLPELHTIYLLNGVDITSLSPKQIKFKGRSTREVFYSIVTGRLGRLGAAPNDNEGSAPQRVISIVDQGTNEEAALQDLFEGRLIARNNASVPEFAYSLSRWPGPLDMAEAAAQMVVGEEDADWEN